MSFIHLDAIQACHEAYLSAIGRALAVCQHFEDCVRHVAAVYAITDEISWDDAPDTTHPHELDRLRAIARRLGAATLGQCLRGLGGSADFGIDRFSLVDRGRAARNWLAHEAASIVDSAHDSFDEFIHQVCALRNHVAALCLADAIVSVASHEICEREPAPRPYADSYAERLQNWILTPLACWLYSFG